MAHDVFISHSSKDKTTADAVCAVLESNGVRCWIAPRDVTPGMEWGECIIDAIEECRIMVLVFTTNANDSPQIHREVERAVNHGVAILPFRIEDVLPGKALEYFIGDVHWLDAMTTPLETHLNSLADTVKMLLSRMPPRAAPIPGTATQPPTASLVSDLPGPSQVNPPPARPVSTPGIAGDPQKPLTRRLWFRALLGTAALLIVLFAALHFSQKPATRQPQGVLDWSTSDLATLQSTAKNGNAAAQYELGYRYIFGQGGVSQDYSQAFTWLRKSAEQGDAAGENGLGNLYESGQGTARDVAQAVAWYRKSADQDYAAGQNNMGYMYEQGLGVTKDYAQALVWFHKAADQGYGMALGNLGEAYLYGYGVPKDPAQARAWFQKAADQGDENARRELATMAGRQ